jgi:hypothetical protein
LAARLWTEPAGSGQVEGPYCAVQHDDGSGSPSLGVVTCASHRSVLVGWGIVRVVTTGSRRGSDDAIGAELLPLGAAVIAAAVVLAAAVACVSQDVNRRGTRLDVARHAAGAGESGCRSHWRETPVDRAAVNCGRRVLAERTFAATDVYLLALRPAAFRRWGRLRRSTMRARAMG